MKSVPPCCQESGHNFQVASIIAKQDDQLVDSTVIFCTKCGETRPLRITVQDEDTKVQR